MFSSGIFNKGTKSFFGNNPRSSSLFSKSKVEKILVKKKKISDSGHQDGGEESDEYETINA